MSLGTDLVEAIRKLTALEMRTGDLRDAQNRIEAKIDSLLERLARPESDFTYLGANVKNDIMADIKADLTRAQVYLELQRRGLLKQQGVGPSTP